MNSVSYFRYITKDSFLHKMNSKIKILNLLLLLLSIILVNNNYIYLVIFIIIFFTMIKSKINLNVYLINFLELWVLYVITFLISYFITFDVYKSCFILVKEFYIVFLFLILTFTTSLSEISWGFECLFNPLKKYKLPVSKISLKLALSIKFLSSFVNKYKEIKKSILYRGISYNSRLKLFKEIFLSSIRLSINLTKKTSLSMKLRFYGYKNNRTNYHDNKKTKLDKLFIFLNCVLLYIIISIRLAR